MDEQEKVFQLWLEEYKGIIYKIVRAYSGPGGDHEDLCQEILCQLWLSIPSFQQEAGPSTWIYRVALNTAMAWQRKERRRLPGEALLQLAEPRDESAGTKVERRELVQQLYKLIYSLPKIDCAIALLYLNGQKHREMAEILGISETHVAVRLHRIKTRLSGLMKGTGDENR